MAGSPIKRAKRAQAAQAASDARDNTTDASDANDGNTSLSMRQLRKAIKDMQAERDAAIRELLDVQELLARVDPEKLQHKIAEPLKAYDPAICQTMITMASQGIGQDEIMSALGVSRELWGEWVDTHSSFKAAVSLARIHARGAWQRKARLSMESGSWSFRIDSLPRILDSLFPAPKQADGDAAGLVLIDGRRSATAGATDANQDTSQ